MFDLSNSQMWIHVGGNDAADGSDPELLVYKGC